MKTTSLSEIELIHNVKVTPIMDIVFESGLIVTKVRWSMQAIEVIIGEMEGAGFSSKLIELLRKQFYERYE